MGRSIGLSNVISVGPLAGRLKKGASWHDGYSRAMEVKLTPDQKAFVSDAIESGRLKHEEEAVREALALWEERERTRAGILAAVDESDASLARGEGRVITKQSMLKLAPELKQPGRAPLPGDPH